MFSKINEARRPVSVLFIHSCGTFGGASRSLLEMIESYPEGSVKAHLITQNGNVVSFFEKIGVPVIVTKGITQFDNTYFGHYHGWRCVLLLREFLFWFVTLWALLRARKAWSDIELVHVNEVTMLWPIILAKWLFHTPVVVHVRSLQQTKNRLRVKMIGWVLKRYTDAVISIDETVKRSVPPGVGSLIIHNGFRIKDPVHLAGLIRKARERRQSGGLVVGMVANFLIFKGIYEFVQAAKICRDRGLNIQFILVGQNVRSIGGLKGMLVRKMKLVHDVESDILHYMQQHELLDMIKLVGFTADIQEIYASIDVLCFPSHLNAVGRPVFEAAFMKVPSIVAIKDPLEDTIIDRQTGYCIEAKSSESLADAITYFYDHPNEISRMGELAFELAWKHFDISQNAQQMLAIYHQLCWAGDPSAHETNQDAKRSAGNDENETFLPLHK